MPIPPPPPPPPPPAYGGPPPPPAYSQGRAASVKPKSEGSGGRSALLSDIHKGARLKKVTQINDRSSPQIENAEKSNNSGNGRAAMAPPAGGLFAGGFPALKPPGQRDAGGAKSAVLLPGMKSSIPKPQDQSSANIKPATIGHKSPDLPRPPPPSSAPLSIALRTPPSRPTVLGTTPPGPPPAPPSTSKPQLVLPTVPAAAPPPPPPPLPPPLYKEKPSKFTGISNPPPPPPAPLPSLPLQSQSNMFPKSPRPLSQSFPLPPPPPPSHPPPAPPSGYSTRTDQYPSSKAYDSEYMEVLTSNQAGKDYSHPDSFPPPPPDMLDYPSFPPPPPPPALSQLDRNRPSESLPPPPPVNSEQGVPPGLLKSPAGKNPPLPPIPGTIGRAHKGFPGGKAAPPPPPPTRSPFTELTSRQQPVSDTSNWTSSQISHTSDDFESKFTFHSVEELPPPETYEPSERIYPSKCSDGYQPAPLPPPMRHQMR